MCVSYPILPRHSVEQKSWICKVFRKASAVVAISAHRLCPEKGAGIGLTAVLASLGGAAVVATDGSSEAVQLIQTNVQANLDAEQSARVRTERLDWMAIVQGADEGSGSAKDLARMRLADAGVFGKFDIVVCSALGYVQVPIFHALLGILDLVTSRHTTVIWGAGKEGTIHLNKSWNHEEKAVELDKAFKILSELGPSRPAHLNLYELRRRPSWRGAPIFRTAPDPFT